MQPPARIRTKTVQRSQEKKMLGSIENPEGTRSHEIMMHSKSRIEEKGYIVKPQRR